MPRRADLVLRTKSLQDFLPLDHLKWLSLAEAVEYNSEDFYISGTMVKIFPIVLAKSNSWNYKEWQEDSGALDSDSKYEELEG